LGIKDGESVKPQWNADKRGSFLRLSHFFLSTFFFTAICILTGFFLSAVLFLPFPRFPYSPCIFKAEKGGGKNGIKKAD